MVEDQQTSRTTLQANVLKPLEEKYFTSQMPVFGLVVTGNPRTFRLKIIQDAETL